MIEEFVFIFKTEYKSRFELDGAFYTIIGTKPELPPNRTFKAQFIEKQGPFIHANILNSTGRRIILEIEQ